jgi:hypothetical protein
VRRRAEHARHGPSSSREPARITMTLLHRSATTPELCASTSMPIGRCRWSSRNGSGTSDRGGQVERRDRLRHEQPRPEPHRTRDQHPLSHAAGNSVRVGLHRPGRGPGYRRGRVCRPPGAPLTSATSRPGPGSQAPARCTNVSGPSGWRRVGISARNRYFPVVPAWNVGSAPVRSSRTLIPMPARAWRWRWPCSG